LKYTGERIIPEAGFCGYTTKAYQEHSARYDFAAKYVKNKKVLDIACGVGYGTKILLNAGSKEVIGCDISSESIDYAKQHYSNKQITFKVQDATKLDFTDNYFDCIVSFETIEHVDDYNAVLKEFYRVIKKNGTLIISTPNKDVSSKGKDKPENPFHVKEFTISEISDLLSQNFNSVELYSQMLIIPLNFKRLLIRSIIQFIGKLDFFKIHTKILSETTYVNLGTLTDNTNQNYIPIPYTDDQTPVVLIAVCSNKD